MRRVLLVEDDDAAAADLARIADHAGWTLTRVASTAGGRTAVARETFDLLVVDRMLPDGDGLDWVRSLRARGPAVPVLILSALGRAANKVEGLDGGADDYLAKPFDPDEFVARARALMRRAAMPAESPDLVRLGDVEIHVKARTVHRRGQFVAVSRKEFELLHKLADHAGDVLTRSMLLDAVWNLRFDPQTNVVDVHVSRLRRKLEIDGLPNPIVTQRGEGYAFEPVSPSEAKDPAGTEGPMDATNPSEPGSPDATGARQP